MPRTIIRRVKTLPRQSLCGDRLVLIYYLATETPQQGADCLGVSPLDQIPYGPFEGATAAQGYRGSISPWTTLANGTSTSSGLGSLRSFQETAERLTEEERVITQTSGLIRCDFLQDFLSLTEDGIYAYAKNYAMTAPCPILHWESCRNSMNRILRTKRAVISGEAVCVLIVGLPDPLPLTVNGLKSSKTNSILDLGRPITEGKETHISPSQTESGVFFKKAWVALPELLLEHDLWALKGITLMVWIFHIRPSKAPRLTVAQGTLSTRKLDP